MTIIDSRSMPMRRTLRSDPASVHLPHIEKLSKISAPPTISPIAACCLLSLPSLQLAPDIVAIEPRGLKHCLVTTEALTQRKFHVAFGDRG